MSTLPAPQYALACLSALAMTVSAAPAGAQSAPAASGPPTRTQLSTQLDASFKAIDGNGDGSLNTAEIDAAQKRQIAQAEGEIAKRLEAEFAKLDGNKDGQLSLTEFKAAAPKPRVMTAADTLGQLDKNKDGKVSQDEFRSVPLANFDKIDTNKDGTLSTQEQSVLKR